MSVDLAQMHRIHELEGEIDQAHQQLKEIRDRRRGVVSALPEAKAVEVAQRGLQEAEGRLELALHDLPELEREWSALKVETGELAYHLKDLMEQLSHNLTAYTQDTGREVIRDAQDRNRHIDLIARLSKPSKRVPGQAKLPFSQHFGVRVVIPEIKLMENK